MPCSSAFLIILCQGLKVQPFPAARMNRMLYIRMGRMLYIQMNRMLYIRINRMSDLWFM